MTLALLPKLGAVPPLVGGLGAQGPRAGVHRDPKDRRCVEYDASTRQSPLSSRAVLSLSSRCRSLPPLPVTLERRCAPLTRDGDVMR